MSESAEYLSIYNVTFSTQHFWVGTTCTGKDRDDAIEVGRDVITWSSRIPKELLKNAQVEADYQGVHFPTWPLRQPPVDVN